MMMSRAEAALTVPWRGIAIMHVLAKQRPTTQQQQIKSQAAATAAAATSSAVLESIAMAGMTCKIRIELA